MFAASPCLRPRWVPFDGLQLPGMQAEDRAQSGGLCACARAYSFGDSWFAEVDIVLPSTMSVEESHDIAEALQIKLERLPEIARAFVHIDFETTHVPEHKVQ